MKNLQKEIFNLWIETNPSGAFSNGLSKYAGQMFIPTEENIKLATKKANNLLRNATGLEKRFLQALKLSIQLEEPHETPSSVTGIFFTYIAKEGFKELS